MKKVLAISEHIGPAKAIRQVVKVLRDVKDIKTIIYPTAMTYSAFSGYPELKNLPKSEFENIRGEYMKSGDLESFVQNTFESENPDLILTGSLQPKQAIDKSMIREANKRNIPSVCLMEYWCNPEQYKKRFPSKEFIPTKIMALDEIDKKNLVSANIPTERIVVAGHPSFDACKNERKSFLGNQQDILVKLGFNYNPYSFLVTYIPDPIHSDNYPVNKSLLTNFDTLKTIRKGCALMCDFDDAYIHIPIMLHFKDLKAKNGVYEWKEIISSVENKIPSDRLDVRLGRKSLDDKINLDHVRLVSDLVISGRSTSGAECLYLGAPVVILQPEIPYEENGLKHFIDEGIIPASNDVEMGSQIILKMLVDEDFKSHYIEKQNKYKNQPLATPKIINEMIKLLFI